MNLKISPAWPAPTGRPLSQPPNQPGRYTRAHAVLSYNGSTQSALCREYQCATHVPNILNSLLCGLVLSCPIKNHVTLTCRLTGLRAPREKPLNFMVSLHSSPARSSSPRRISSQCRDGIYSGGFQYFYPGNKSAFFSSIRSSYWLLVS